MYRRLTSLEIEILEQNGSTSSDWSLVEVAEDFMPQFIKHVHFDGVVRLGRFERQHTLPGGVSHASGVYNATLHNCTVDNDVLIKDIHSYIANYDIEDGVVIINCNRIVVTGQTTFGNGTRVSVLSEVGGREVPIYECLSAHLAYIIALYRHHISAVDYIVEAIMTYAQRRQSERGRIGCCSYISDCQQIVNTNIGTGAQITGATLLKEGTVLSSLEAPTIIGELAIMKEFILAYSSVVDGGAVIDKCYVGEGCRIGKQYSAENSLFFANCKGMHGEACSIFAGPYTVTHHKSTLLIAGYFSFMNAGSGSNQSNHMYKLGPIHQGIVERGSKTSSDSYILWPARIGAFSLVMGRHTNHPDTSDLPFSYLLERDNKTLIVPAAALRSVGTIRDAKKWAKRDCRKALTKIDQINFNLLSPYTIQKMERGLKLLTHIKQTSGESSDVYIYNKARIDASALNKGIAIYRMGIYKFLGNSIISRLEGKTLRSNTELTAHITPVNRAGEGAWIDMAGLIAPKEIVDEFINSITTNKLQLDDIHTFFESTHHNYYEYEWTWAAGLMCRCLNKNLAEVTAADLIDLIEKWQQSVVILDRELYEDAKKEFTLIQRIGFGIDGNQTDAETDFEQVRGDFESNSFVREVIEHIDCKQKLGDKTIDALRPLTR